MKLCGLGAIESSESSAAVVADIIYVPLHKSTMNLYFGLGCLDRAGQISGIRKSIKNRLTCLPQVGF
jgi:hypothetical protein